MHNIIRRFLLLFMVLLLTGCACCTTDPKITPIKEDWLCLLNRAPNAWMRGADNWFITGHYRHNPAKNIFSVKIHTPDFDKIVVNGNFTVHIVGPEYTSNSVAVAGVDPFVARALIRIQNRTLYLTQPKDCPLNFANVLVRVGVCNLRSLRAYGCGNIYGRGVLSNGLSLYSSGPGNIMLMGNMNVRDINQLGTGTITLYGVNTPCLTMQVIGKGNVNVCGQVGVQSIVHRGDGKIDILGMDSPQLTIFATGDGLTQALGVANLKRVSAYNHSQVYLYWVQSDNTTIVERDYAKVGVAGTTTTLTVDTKGTSQFEGQYLFARSAYATTHDSSHASVNATGQLFLSANDSSSIYYFSRVKEFSALTTGRGIVLRTHSVPCCLAAPVKRRVYKGEV